MTLPVTISAREKAVLQGVADGKSNVKIAEEMGVSRQVVGVHRHKACRKLGIKGAIAIYQLMNQK